MTLEAARKIYIANLNEFASDMAVLFVEELEQQGHRATGNLIRSVIARVNAGLNEIDIAMSHFNYGVVVNTGVLSARVPYNRGSGAGKSKFIDALMAWIRIRGIAGGLDKTVRRIAFAMATAMKRDGIPTKGSYAFTSNGRRTQWIDYVYNKYQVPWQDRAEEETQDYIEAAFDSMLEKTCNRFKPYLEFSKN